MFVDTIIKQAFGLDRHDQQLTIRAAQETGLTKRVRSGQVNLFLEITYRLLLQPDASLSLTGATLSAACPEEGDAR